MRESLVPSLSCKIRKEAVIMWILFVGFVVVASMLCLRVIARMFFSE